MSQSINCGMVILLHLCTHHLKNDSATIIKQLGFQPFMENEIDKNNGK